MQDVINAVYKYINDDHNPDVCKKRIDNVLEFVIRLRHSYIDNDKPKSSAEVNEEILTMALREGLGVAFVPLDE